jgi:hypothetical protein
MPCSDGILALSSLILLCFAVTVTVTVGCVQSEVQETKRVCVNHIAYTEFEVHWFEFAHTDYLKSYNLTVICEGKAVFYKTVTSSGATECSRSEKIPCSTHCKTYIVQIDASYRTASEGNFKVPYEFEVWISTLNGSMSRICIPFGGPNSSSDILQGTFGTSVATLVILVCVSIVGLICLVICSCILYIYRGQHKSNLIAYTADGQPSMTGKDQPLLITSEAFLVIANNPEKHRQNNRTTSEPSSVDLQDMGSGLHV